MAKKIDDGKKSIARNRRAFHDYDILETFEAGIVLTGTEVRSLRDNNCQLTECFVIIRKNEAWAVGIHISPYRNGSYSNVNPDRNRKLLLHKKQIRHLLEKTREKGMSIVPLEMYFDKNGRVKVEIGLAKGRKLHDKRDAMAKRDAKREMERALKERNRY
ncbi:MAG: SsrA-binding protein SmpB [Coriobacteriales bacterium]|jgi:SsrA-binding protein